MEKDNEFDKSVQRLIDSKEENDKILKGFTSALEKAYQTAEESILINHLEKRTGATQMAMMSSNGTLRNI